LAETSWLVAAAVVVADAVAVEQQAAASAALLFSVAKQWKYITQTSNCN